MIWTAGMAAVITMLSGYLLVGIFIAFFCAVFIAFYAVNEAIYDNRGSRMPNDLILLDMVDMDHLSAWQMDRAMSSRWWMIGPPKAHMLVASYKECPITKISLQDLSVNLKEYEMKNSIRRIDDRLKTWDRSIGFYFVGELLPEPLTGKNVLPAILPQKETA